MPDCTEQSGQYVFRQYSLNSIRSEEAAVGVQMIEKCIRSVMVCVSFLVLTGCQEGRASSYVADTAKEDAQDLSDHLHNDDSNNDISELGCKKASSQQIFQVNLGNEKKDQFIDTCIRETGSSYWCGQLIHPNWNSANTFRCTYGAGQIHQLVHPSENLWRNPIAAVKIIQELTSKGIKVCEIYNWWRPEPYNKNVGGAAGRHPYGTSVDVRFCSNSEADRAFLELCKIRKQGRIRAIGHYGSASLHIGVGDKLANTWGRSCP